MNQLAILNDHFCILIQVEEVLIKMLCKWKLQWTLLLFQDFLWLDTVNVSIFIFWSFITLFLFLSSLDWLHKFLTLVWTDIFMSFDKNSFIILNNNRLVFLKEHVMQILGNLTSFGNYFNFVSWNCFRSRFQNSGRFIAWGTIFKDFRSE